MRLHYSDICPTEADLQKFRKFEEELERAVKQRQIAQIKEHPEQADEVLDEMNFLKNFDETVESGKIRSKTQRIKFGHRLIRLLKR